MEILGIAIDAELLSFLTIPPFTSAIGLITNWTGVIMLFQPVRFWGIRIPGLRLIAPFLPRRVQQVPVGLPQGRFGWQGIVPSRAAKMGSIAVDKGISKLGSPAEFYAQLEPEKIARHVVSVAEKDIRRIVERIMQRDHPELWADLPPAMRNAIHDRVAEQLPGTIRKVTDEIGQNIDHMLDVKLMVIHQFEAHPELANEIFQGIGRRELRLMVWFGLFFGFLLGIPVAFIDHATHAWWVLPVLGVIVGYVTNLLGIWMIFEPVEPRRIGPFTFQGFFIRRQPQVSEIYAGIVALKVVTMQAIGDELTNGPQSDRTRKMIRDALHPAIDRALGPFQPAVRVAIGPREYDRIRDSVVAESVEYTLTPFADPQFSREQSTRVRDLIASRMREMSPTDFSEMLRTVIREDEWLLYLHGAVLGLGGGGLHVAIFGV